MDKLTAFKVAFLSRCAEEGLDLDQIHERVKEALSRVAEKLKPAETEKSAVVGPVGVGLGIGAGMSDPGMVSKTLKAIYGGLTGFANSPSNTLKSDLASIGSGAALGWNSDKIWPLIVGGGALLGGAGIAAGKMLADSSDDPLAAEQAKQQELLNEYKRLTEKAKRQKKLRELKGF